jgi:predicted SnoaL-like aldol condensation-catalyzing enzyme
MSRGIKGFILKNHTVGKAVLIDRFKSGKFKEAKSTVVANYVLIEVNVGEIRKGNVTAFTKVDQHEPVPLQPKTEPSWSCFSC